MTCVGVLNDSNLYDIVDINDISDPTCVLKSIKNMNINCLVIWGININGMHKKFDLLVSMIKDVIDNSFPTQLFLIDGYGSHWVEIRRGSFNLY